MNTKITYDEALQTLVVKTMHCSENERVYITFDDENGYSAITANLKLNDPKYTYVGTLGDHRELALRKFERNFKITTIYNRIYNKLIRLIPNLENLEVGDHGTSESASSCMMALHFDVLEVEKKEQQYTKVISLAHYYEQNGDLVPDPDMTIRIYSQTKMAEALTFQNCYIYQEVYPTPDTCYPKLKTSLNSFLNNWLSSCIDIYKFFGNKKTNSGDC